MANIVGRETARGLRRKGRSISDIAKELNFSKSTVSYWCRDIILSPEQLQRLTEKSKHAGTKQFLLLGEQKRMARKTREQKQRNLGKKEVKGMGKRDLFFLGLGLYWGEGYKTGNGELGFTNSDREMLLMFLQWLRDIYGVQTKDLILRVSINEIHAGRIAKVQKYWSDSMGIPLSQFTKPSFIKSAVKKRYPNHNEHYGVLRIKVRKGSTLKQRILGALEELHSQT